jgi:hypothetical protein
MATLRQCSVDLLEQAVGVFANWHIAQDDLSIPYLDGRLAALPGATILVHGFGASDCRAGCRAHLVAFPREVLPCTTMLASPQIQLVLAQTVELPPDSLVCECFA